MIVTLDGQRVDGELAAGGTLQSVLDLVRSRAPQRLIVSVNVNGTPLGDEALQAALEQPVGPQAQVDLESGDPQQLVHDALCGLAAEFEQAGRSASALADRLAASSADAVREVGRLIELWQTCYRVVVQCSGLLGRDLTECLHEQRPMKEYFGDVVTQLTELRSALEDRDQVRVADQVRYEWPSLCSTWQAILASIAQQVAAQPLSTAHAGE